MRLFSSLVLSSGPLKIFKLFALSSGPLKAPFSEFQFWTFMITSKDASGPHLSLLTASSSSHLYSFFKLSPFLLACTGSKIMYSSDTMLFFSLLTFVLISQRKTREIAVSKSSVESMSRVVIGEDKEKGGGSCAICLEEWSKGDVAAEMPCEHKFHSKCVEEWLGMHATCPLCRYEMPVDEEEEEEGKKVGVWIGFSINGGERRNEEDGGGRRAPSDGDLHSLYTVNFIEMETDSENENRNYTQLSSTERQR